MSMPTSSEFGQQPFAALPPDLLPSIEHLTTEDDTPVDNIYSEKQQRLLTHPLYASWPGPGMNRPFIAMSNVGLFYSTREPPVVPDALLSLDVRLPDDLKPKKSRSYFLWEYGKGPEVTCEVVSNKEGEELGSKMQIYARIGVPIYVVWDPFSLISPVRLQIFMLRFKTYVPADSNWFSEVGLGLTLWHGEFEHMADDWLRWCDQQRGVILTGEELSRLAEERAQSAEERAQSSEERARMAEERNERLKAQLRQLGVEPKNGDE